MNTDQNICFERLFEAIVKLETTEECRRFFGDICTIKELIEISQRLKVAEMLNEGKNYADIVSETGASTATISRVNRCFLYGEGGYKDIIAKLQKGDGNDENG